MKSNSYVVEHFRIPEVAPKPVLAANKRFQELSAELQSVTGEWNGAIATRSDDLADLNKAAAQSRVNGTAPPPETADSIDANIARLKAERDVLLGSVDLAGNQLAEACEKHCAEWLAMLDKIEASATERLRVALEAARAAVEDLDVPRTAPEWVRDFRASRAVRGDQTTWHPGGVGGRDALDTLDKIVTPEKVLTGYRGMEGGRAEPVFEEVVVGQKKRRPVSAKAGEKS